MNGNILIVKEIQENIVNKTINGDTTGAEGTEDHVDYLCNGFKVRRTGNDINKMVTLLLCCLGRRTNGI